MSRPSATRRVTGASVCYRRGGAGRTGGEGVEEVVVEDREDRRRRRHDLDGPAVGHAVERDLHARRLDESAGNRRGPDGGRSLSQGGVMLRSAKDKEAKIRPNLTEAEIGKWSGVVSSGERAVQLVLR